MQIGPYSLKNNVWLAPMAGVTDRPYRQLCRKFGAGLAVSEMVSSNTTLHGNLKTVRRLDHEGETGPISVQIVGADPHDMAEAAKRNVDLGAQIIDINMGCPAKKVCKTAAGSALLKNEPLVADILKAVVNAVDVPVTLKIRTGWSPDTRNGVKIARLAESIGIQALAVHGRTRACGYRGDAEYDTIRQIKDAIQIPVIANGDIRTPEKAQQVLEQTGVDAVMIGRAAQGHPWIFQEINHFLALGETLPAPTALAVKKILTTHITELYEFYGEHLGVRIARKHIAWYSKAYPESAAFRAQAYKLDSAQKQLALIDQYFDGLVNQQESTA